jgi:hypothetical protein
MNTNTSRMKSYHEFKKVYPAARAFELIPQMYNRLTLIDGLTHKDALAKMHNDHDHLHGLPQGIFADICLQITLMFQEELGRRVLKTVGLKLL